jgi:hypothetical protein
MRESDSSILGEVQPRISPGDSGLAAYKRRPLFHITNRYKHINRNDTIFWPPCLNKSLSEGTDFEKNKNARI